jgi:hypothetical protein
MVRKELREDPSLPNLETHEIEKFHNAVWYGIRKLHSKMDKDIVIPNFGNFYIRKKALARKDPERLAYWKELPEVLKNDILQLRKNYNEKQKKKNSSKDGKPADGAQK